MIEFIFWLSLFMILYTYFGYPIILVCLISVRKIKETVSGKTGQVQTVEEAFPNKYLPSVSFIITAYNEEKRIEEKIINSLQQNYPTERMELIVASDCSSDNTDQIVKSYAGEGVKLVRAGERKGKENAQKYAVKASSGEILVFSDVATILKQDAIEKIVSNFANPYIGCVSSEDRFIDVDGKVSGEGAYVKYEMFLRKLESRFNTVVGLSGSFFSARREVCHKWATDLQSDFNTLLNSIKMGLKGISDSESIGYYQNIADEKKEFNRKIRTVLRGISVLMRNWYLLNPKRYGLFAWQLFSHKLCRWLVPFFLLLVFISNLMILKSPIYLIMFFAQLSFYAMAIYYYQYTSKPDKIAGWTKRSQRIGSILAKLSKIPYFFTTVNISILIAWIKYISGERATFWEPSKR